MPKIASLSADLVANTSKFEADLKRADRTIAQSQRQWSTSLGKIDQQFGALGGSVGKLTGGLFGLGKALLPILGITGAAGLAALAKNALDTVGGLGELSSQLGVSTDDLQSFQYAATQVGLSSAEMETALARLTRTIGDAANGEKQAVDAFNRLGVGVLDASGKVRSTSDVIRDAADQLANIDDPARRAAIAVDLFGKAGQRMLPFLENGRRGIDALVGEAKSLGLVFDQQIIAQADEASDKLATLSTVLGTQFKAILIELGPILTAVADQILKITKAIRLDGTGIGDLQTLDQAIAKYDRLQSQYDGFLQSYNQQVQLSKDFGGSGIDSVTNFYLDKLTAKAGELEAVRRVVDQMMMVDPSAPAAAGGTTNPPVASTGTSAAAKEAEAVARRLMDLRFQLEQLGRGETAQAIATALKDIRPTPDQATEIANLVTQIHAVGEAAKAEREEFDKLIDDLVTEGEARQAEIAAIFAATRTPAEEYAAEVERLHELLGGSAENQDLLNRALDAAKVKYDAASESSSTFRDIADDAAGVLWAGLTDAVFAADNLKEALAGVLLQLAKMAANRVFAEVGDFALDALFGTAATGGPRSGLTLVGERGPELVNLPNGSYVVPSMRSSGMMQQMVPNVNIGAAGGIKVVNNISVEGGGTREQNAEQAGQIASEIKRAVADAVDERIGYQQRGGGAFNPGMGF